MTFDAQYLHDQIAAVCPIVGLSIGHPSDKATWRIDYAPSATSAQQTAALSVVTNFNVVAPTEDDVDTFRDARLATGFVDATTGKTFQCDAGSRGFLTAIGASAQGTLAMSPQPTFQIISADNSVVALSSTAAYALTNGRIMPWVSATMLYARTMKNNILAGNPPADITQGWP